MVEKRVVVTLLLDNGALVKTVRFKRSGYLGDPLNAIRIFNEFEVDELVFLDIGVGKSSGKIRFDLIQQFADQCFMPVSYGGGVSTLEQMQRIFQIGIEKVSLNTAALIKPDLIRFASERFGSQSVLVSVDVKKDWLGRYRIFSQGRTLSRDPLLWCEEAERLGAGELLINSVDRDGTWAGYDLGLIQQVASRVSIPVVALGGAGCLADLGKAITIGGASAAAAGSLFVYQKKGMGVLLSYPDRATLLRTVKT